MSQLNPIDSLFQKTNQPAEAPIVKAGSLEAFEDIIDHLVARKLSQPGVSQAAINAQQSLEDFRHKLAVLTGMLEQAQIAMNSAPAGSGVPTQDEQQYFLLRSKLSQVGLPDGVNNLI